MKGIEDEAIRSDMTEASEEGDGQGLELVVEEGIVDAQALENGRLRPGARGGRHGQEGPHGRRHEVGIAVGHGPGHADLPLLARGDEASGEEVLPERGMAEEKDRGVRVPGEEEQEDAEGPDGPSERPPVAGAFLGAGLIPFEA